MSIHTLEQRVARLEAELTQLKQPKQNAEAVEPWWKKIVGVFADSPEFEAAVERGREYRQSLVAIEQANHALAFAAEQSSTYNADAYSLFEAISTLKRQIKIAIDRHYTFIEIAEILNQQGIPITPKQLQQYYLIAIDKPLSTPKPRTRRHLGTNSRSRKLKHAELV
jgi:hypothetical protein